MEAETDKELLRARLEPKAYDISLFDMDFLVAAYEKAVIEATLNVDIEGVSAFGH